jgi:hypothetical protein
MTEEQYSETATMQMPEAEIRTGRSFSLIWSFPSSPPSSAGGSFTRHYPKKALKSLLFLNPPKGWKPAKPS